MMDVRSYKAERNERIRGGTTKVVDSGKTGTGVRGRDMGIEEGTGK